MDFLKQDVDRLLSYETKQQVHILDRWLGIANITFQILILTYIIGFVFIYDQGYLEHEHARGITATHVNKAGDVVVQSSGKVNTRSFSVEELTYPTLESGNLFVSTKIEILKQKRGTCEDSRMKCDSHKDCSADVVGECTDGGFCVEPGWCAAEGETSEIYKTPTASLQVWVKSMIQFFSLNKERIFTTNLQDAVVYPEEHANTYAVEDLLLLCEPPVRYEEISELGAAVEVQFRWWNCPANKEQCKPEIFAQRVDSLFDAKDIGFSYKFAVPTKANERDLYTMHGVRFYFRTVGQGQEVSITSVIFKISTGIALLSLAPLLADFIMLKCVSDHKKYAARKFEYSQDLGDYFETLDQLPVVEEKSESDYEHDDEEDLAWRRRMEEEDA